MASYYGGDDKASELDEETEVVDIFRRVEKMIRRLGVMPPQSRRRGCKGVVQDTVTTSTDAFNFPDVFDLSDVERNTPDNRARILTVNPSSSSSSSEQDSLLPEHLRISSIARIFKIDGLPEGFFIITNVISAQAQLHWARQALEAYSASEYTNLTNLEKSSNAADHQEGIPAQQEISLACMGTAAAGEAQSTCSTSVTTDNSSKGLWGECLKRFQMGRGTDFLVKGVDEERLRVVPSPRRLPVPGGQELQRRDHNINMDKRIFGDFNKLRWASLGYHYNWTLRQYQPDLKAPIPSDFSFLCKQVAGMVGCSLQAEAAIINYYPLGTNMSGHIDDAEHCLEEPIVSFSIGCPAVFLIGGKSKREAPTAILLRSGDALVMSGVSRTCYHGVPLIMKHGSTKGSSCSGSNGGEQGTFSSRPVSSSCSGGGNSPCTGDQQAGDMSSLLQVTPPINNERMGTELLREFSIVPDPVPSLLNEEFVSRSACEQTVSDRVTSLSDDHSHSTTIGSNTPISNSGGVKSLLWCCDICYLSNRLFLSSKADTTSISTNNGNADHPSHSFTTERCTTHQDTVIDDADADSRSSTIRDDGQSFRQQAALQYLQQARINLNSRRVTSLTGEWVVKCGTGAVMQNKQQQQK